MARIDNNVRLNAFLSNPDNLGAVGNAGPRAGAVGGEAARHNRATKAKRARRAERHAAYVAALKVGQKVRAGRFAELAPFSASSLATLA